MLPFVILVFGNYWLYVLAKFFGDFVPQMFFKCVIAMIIKSLAHILAYGFELLKLFSL